MSRSRPPLGLLLGLALLGTARAQPASPGLPPCPDTPNCVSTEAPDDDTVHHLAPLPLPAGLDPEAALDAFEAVVRADPRTEVVDRTPLRLRALDRTRWLRFVDDIDARVDPRTRLLHVRSAARVGGGDLGVNRRRVTRWLLALATAWDVPRDGVR